MSAARSIWTLPPDPLTRAEVRALWLAHAQHADSDRLVTSAWAAEIGAGISFEHHAVDVWADAVDAVKLTPRSPVPFPVFRPELLPERVQADAKALVKRRGPGILVPLCGPTTNPWNTLHPDSLVVLWGKKDPPWSDHVLLPGMDRQRGPIRPALHDPPTPHHAAVLVVEGLRNALAARAVAALWDLAQPHRTTRVVGLLSLLDLPGWVAQLGTPARVVVVRALEAFRWTERAAALKSGMDALAAVTEVQDMDWHRLAARVELTTAPTDLADIVRARGTLAAAQAMGETLQAQWEAA